MRIGLLIDNIASLYSRQCMGHHDHEYIIYRDQLNQHSSQTTISHHHQIMQTGLDYLIAQGVDHIICPPMIELHFAHRYPQILPLFEHYIKHSLQRSIVGKIGFVGSRIQCESINLHRGDIKTTFVAPGEGSCPEDGGFKIKQTNNRHFNANFPIRTSPDHHLTHRLTDHRPDHYICNTIIKGLLRPLKDAHVDTVIGLDWAYYACDVSWTHHCRRIKRHRSNILQDIFSAFSFQPSAPGGYMVSIHHTGTLHDLEHNKKLRWLLARGQNIEIQQDKIN